MKKKIAIFLFLFLALSAVIIMAAGFKNKEKKVCFKNNCFKVELVLTEEERKKGLMLRERLEDKEGMLFVFEKEGEYSFWMKNTLIPLDIIWINEKKEVVFIGENAQPCSQNECFPISPGKKAKYVLEINAGKAKEIGLKTGDKMDFKIFTW